MNLDLLVRPKFRKYKEEKDKIINNIASKPKASLIEIKRLKN